MEREGALRERLEELIALHAPLVDLALELLRDGEIAPEARVPLAAAAHYGAEKLDLIPDEFPAYGLVDDLFVLAIGLERTLEAAGEAGARYAGRELGGRPLRERFDEMRERFYGFWTFCDQQTASFFADFDKAYRSDPAVLEAATDELARERDGIAEATREVRLEPEHVEQFLARFRAFRAEDFA
ncbi:MAG: DUF1232 domain-containing protein [Planctomycetota bacterium]|nr:MAG: DUF1232 domain-containing protein [Planctomycetota bacterium]